jgi:PAS domain S-box-containing protein
MPVSNELDRLRAEVVELRSMLAQISQADVPLAQTPVTDTRHKVAAERKLTEARRWMELAQEFGGVASYHLNIVTGELVWSPSVYRLYELTPGVAPSLEVWLARIHSDDRAQVERNVSAAVGKGTLVDQYFRVQVADRVRWIHDRGRVEVDASGKPAHVYGVNVDVTPARLEHVALDESERRFRNTFEHANVGMAHVGLDGRFIRVNNHLCRLLGRSEPELLDVTFQQITHPDDLAADVGQLEAVVAGSIDAYTMEKRYIRPDGSLIWADLSVSLLRAADGTPVKFIAIVADIAERKRAQEQVELTLAEAAHRTRNLMAVTGAIVSQSARNAATVQELESAVATRLRSMAASLDLLVGKYANGSTLTRLVRRQLEIFAVASSDRVQIEGCHVELSPKAVHAFGMVIHELATNATKYGALAGDAGAVRVSWTIDKSASELQFNWLEENGPPVRKTGKPGFGARALERMLTGALGGTAELSLPESGARFTASLPVAMLIS